MSDASMYITAAVKYGVEHAAAVGAKEAGSVLEFAETFLEWMTEKAKGGEPVAAGPGAGSPPPQQATVTPIGPPPSQPTGEACEVCGQAKQWKNGGISRKSGKPYDGFWSCPSYRQHPKTTA